jgi:hypothetical protein
MVNLERKVYMTCNASKEEGISSTEILRKSLNEKTHELNCEGTKRNYSDGGGG